MKGKELLQLCKVYKGEAQNPYSDFENKTIWIAEKEIVTLYGQIEFTDEDMFRGFVSGRIGYQAKGLDPENIAEWHKYLNLKHSYYQPQYK